MRFKINHVTRYDYSESVSLCHSIAHLKPSETQRQRCLFSQIRVDPWPAVHREYEDFFGNRVSYFSIQQTHDALEVRAQSEVEVMAPKLPQPASTQPWERIVDRLRDRDDAPMTDLRIFTLPSPLVPADPDALAFAAESFTAGRPILEAPRSTLGREVFRRGKYYVNRLWPGRPIFDGKLTRFEMLLRKDRSFRHSVARVLDDSSWVSEALGGHVKATLVDQCRKGVAIADVIGALLNVALLEARVLQARGGWVETPAARSSA